MAATAGRVRGRPRLRGPLLVLTGLALVVAAVPAPLVRGETQTLTAPTKVITAGAQQGTYAASDLEADDGALDGTDAEVTASSEDPVAGPASAASSGTESGTYLDTAANDGAIHQLTAQDRFDPPTDFVPVSPAKVVVKGTQQGTYAPASVDADDETTDTTQAGVAGEDASPATASPSANDGLWTGASDAHASDDVRASSDTNNLEGAWWGWSFTVPSDATVTAVEAILEWHATRTNACLEVRSSVDGGVLWSGYAVTPMSDTSDRTDTLDLTAQRAWTPADLNSGTNLRLGVKSTKCSGGPTPLWRLDHVQLRVTFTYNVEAAFTFFVAEPENHWTQLALQDSSAGDAGCAAEIYRVGAGTWESLGWTLGTTEAAHAATISANPDQYVNASNEVKVRYRCSGMAVDNDLVVDLLSLTVTYTPYAETRLEYVYEMTTTRRPSVTSVAFSDSSHRTTGDVEVHAYRFATSSWVALWTVAEGAETGHSSGALAGPADYIDEATGALRVRYRSVTFSEGILPAVHVDHLHATVTFDLHAVDVEYEFTASLDPSSWTRIWVNDSASAAPAASVFLYNFATAAWDPLGGGYSATESAHSRVVSAGAPDYGDGANRVRVRFAWSAEMDPTGLGVDLLTVTVTGNTAPTLPSFTASDDTASRDPAVLNDDGVDWTEVAGEVEDVNGEGDVVAIEVRLYSSFDGSTVTYSRTVTAADRAQDLEPGSVDNQVVVWNPTADDDRLSFKLRHVWQMEDHTDPDYYEFTAAALDTWGPVTVFSAQKITRTVEAWFQMVINDGVANRVYDATGTATSGAWGQWTAVAGEAPVESGAGASEEGRYIKIENVGTGAGPATISWDDVAFVGDADPTWTIPIDGVLDFHYAVGTALDPSTIGSWTTIADDADGTVILSIGGGLIAWVWYSVDVPDPAEDQGYSQTFTIA